MRQLTQATASFDKHGKVTRRALCPAIEALTFPVRARALPSTVRGAYALALKRLWQHLWRRPVVRSISSVGLMKLRPNALVSCRLAVFGVWEPVISNFVRQHVTDGAVCIDVGAHIGYYSLMMSRLSPSGVVYAIEPSPQIRAELEENVSLNAIKNAVVLPYGISDRSAELAFKLDPDRSMSRFADDGDQAIEVRPLADAIPPEHLARTQMLKIDVEGMEDRVLRHILHILDRFPSRLTICTEVRVNDTTNEILAQFRGKGFEMVKLANDYGTFSYAEGEWPTPRPVTSLPTGQHDIALVRK